MNEAFIPQTFFVKDCALVPISTGERAGSLIELRDKLAVIHPGCIYFHFWGGRLQSYFAHPEDHNDFAGWAHHHLHDLFLTEKLAAIDPQEFTNIEDLRQELLNIIEDRLEETDVIVWRKKEEQFHFIRSKIIVFDTPLKIENPAELPHIIEKMTTSSIFYHFIDARRRTEAATDDFSAWLKNFGADFLPLIESLRSIDLYFLSPLELRQKLVKTIHIFFEKSLYNQ
jgi:hypothetical protein